MTNAVAIAQYGSTSPNKNRIINGAMVIDQRWAGGAGSTAINLAPYSVDRWQVYGDTVGKFTYQQNAGSVTPPAGYSNYLGITSSSAYSLISTSTFLIRQFIEGYNMADLAWGTSSAKSVTLSFWAYSSLTGTFGGSIINGAENYAYPFSYTISSANTWTQISITIAGPTAGTWAKTNTAGIEVVFSLGIGSTYSGTAGAWASAAYFSSTGANSIVSTSGATFYITGVQLEAGTTASPFEYRQYGTELALCQRYFEKSYNIDVVPGTSTTVGIIAGSGVQGATGTGEVDAGASFKATKRATPTIAYWDQVGNSGKCTRVQLGVTGNNNSTIADNNIGASSFFSYSASGATASAIWFHYTATAEL